MPEWISASQVDGLWPPNDPRFPPPPPPSLPLHFNPPVQAVTAKLILPSNPPKDPLLMGILSGCLIAGLGQMVLGQVTKGVMILIGSMVVAVLTAGISIFVTWPLGGIDAYLIAKKLKNGQSVGEWECF